MFLIVLPMNASYGTLARVATRSPPCRHVTLYIKCEQDKILRCSSFIYGNLFFNQHMTSNRCLDLQMAPVLDVSYMEHWIV